jgi:hypothetical protein
MASQRLPHPAEPSTTGVDGSADEAERSRPPMDLEPDGLDTASRLQHIEARIGDIARALDHRSSPAESHGTAPRDSDSHAGSLLSRIEALEARVGSYAADVYRPRGSVIHNEATRGPGGSAPESTEIAHLRFQVATLATQLARAEADLGEVRGGRVRRWRHGGHNAGWRFWRRR